MTSAHACAQPGDSRRIAAIFADHQGAYRAAYPPSSGQKRVISAIAACRTAPVEFMRRFLLHVLPKGFVKIRHYGIYAGKQVRHVLPKARALIESMDVRGARRPHGVTQQMARATSQNQGIIAGPWQARLKLLTGIDVTRCRHCGSHRLHQHPLPRQDSS